LRQRTARIFACPNETIHASGDAQLPRERVPTRCDIVRFRARNLLRRQIDGVHYMVKPSAQPPRSWLNRAARRRFMSVKELCADKARSSWVGRNTWFDTPYSACKRDQLGWRGTPLMSPRDGTICRACSTAPPARRPMMQFSAPPLATGRQADGLELAHAGKEFPPVRACVCIRPARAAPVSSLRGRHGHKG